MKSTDKLFLSGFGIILAIGMVTVALSPPAANSTHVEKASQPKEATTSATRLKRTTPVGISEIARGAYTRAEYPSTFQKFGKQVPEINADRATAAQIAAFDPACDFVENAQITSSSPREDRRYWVECSNLTRLYFDQVSLSNGEAVKVQAKADWIRDGLEDW